MKGLVLAGGRGTRLRPITYTSAKQLIPIANKPILFYGLDALSKAGIKEVGIVVGETYEEIKHAVSKENDWNFKVTYIKQEAPLGLAHAVKISKDFLGNEPFVMYLGDNLLRDNIESFVNSFKKGKPQAQILLASVPHPEQFGVAELNGKRVIRLVEKPLKPISNYALVGVYLFDSKIFDVIEKLKPSNRGELEITDAIQGLIDNGDTVRAEIVTGWWKDTGKIEDLLEANRLILETIEADINGKIDSESKIEGKVIISKSAHISDSTIRGPAIIGENARITSSYIGPYTSIGQNVKIEKSEVEHSILLGGAEIRSLRRLTDSLIGHNAKVVHTPKKPQAFRILIGDYSQIDIP